MSMLSNFKTFNFNEGVPYVSVTSNGVTFNKSVVLKLGKPEYAVFLFDEESQRIAVKACTKETDNSTQFYKPKKNNVISVRWNGKDLLNTIQMMMNWDLNVNAYRAEGALLKEDNAMIFDLSKATVLK
ncbi:MAG: hypothetical protein IJF80_01625 [Clostridia bacterium]|nr:hypothetical protein [Clostridia bacterium]